MLHLTHQHATEWSSRPPSRLPCNDAAKQELYGFNREPDFWADEIPHYRNDDYMIRFLDLLGMTTI